MPAPAPSAPLAALAPPSAPGVSAPRASADQGRMREAARRFEAQMLGQMLQPMFATADLSRSRFGGGTGEAQWQPMLVDAFAQAASRRGGFGIADAVYREMLRVQSARSTRGNPAP
ncbi:rod-binding protein [Plastoroseomonas hellenica]|nr:rod-binding protein [Plastoroseomonas hellenica]